MNAVAKIVGLGFAVGLTAACGIIPGQSDDSSVTTLPPGTPTRLIRHAMGTTQVPVQPKRIVVLDTAALDSAIALGIKPIGTIFFQSPPTYLNNQVQGIEVIGLNNNPNLEKVLSLKPDLILGNKISSEQFYSKLAKAAPTVLTEGSGRSGDWQENFQLYADALGRSPQAKVLLEQYQQRATELKQRLQQRFPQPPVVSIVATGNKQIGAYTQRSFSGSVFQDVGLARPPAQEKPERWAIQVSPEEFASLDGDAIFLIEAPGIPNSLTVQAFKTDPVFSNLNAVKQGRVYPVNAEVWTAGRSILAANKILDDLSQHLLGASKKQKANSKMN
jgi:iron complex transport system substrate-binding protein